MRSPSPPSAALTAAIPLSTLIPLLVVCCISAIVYANSVFNGFVSDDHYIIEIRREPLDLSTVLQVFTGVDNLFEGQQAPYYRPLNRLTYIVERAVIGLDPRWYHAVNIFLHLTCIALLYFMLVRSGCDVFASFTAALLFGVHPLNTEAVNFISGRNNILSAIFSLAAVIAFLRAEDKQSRAGYVVSGVSVFLGLLSKETTVMTIPFIVFLKWFRSQERPTLREILRWDMTFLLPPVLALSAYLFLRFFAIDNSYIQEHMSGIVSRIRDMVYIIPTYFSLFFIPYPLTFHHVVPNNLSAIALPLALQWTSLVIVAVLILRYRNRMVILGVAWLVINFIPISTIVPIPSASMAERYLYLPLIGACIIAGDLFQRLRVHAGTTQTVILLILIVLPFGILTTMRNRDWKDNLALNRSMIAADPSFWLGHFEFGYESYVRGDRTTALREFEIALQLAPHAGDAAWIHYYVGAIDLDTGETGKALRHFREAVKKDPLKPAAHYALATLLTADKAAALSEYQEFLRTAQMSLSSMHLLSEVNSKLIELGAGRPIGAAHGRTPALTSFPGWDPYALLSSGTALFFNPEIVQAIRERRIVTTRHLLATRDRRAYGLKLIKFPLEAVTEALFTIDISCETHLYKMTHMAFLDGSGAVLGALYPEREWHVMHEYLMPNTPLRSLADRICRQVP